MLKIPSMRIMQLAEAVAPGVEIKFKEYGLVKNCTSK